MCGLGCEGAILREQNPYTGVFTVITSLSCTHRVKDTNLREQGLSLLVLAEVLMVVKKKDQNLQIG